MDVLTIILVLIQTIVAIVTLVLSTRGYRRNLKRRRKTRGSNPNTTIKKSDGTAASADLGVDQENSTQQLTGDPSFIVQSFTHPSTQLETVATRLVESKRRFDAMSTHLFVGFFMALDLTVLILGKNYHEIKGQYNSFDSASLGIIFFVIASFFLLVRIDSANNSRIFESCIYLFTGAVLLQMIVHNIISLATGGSLLGDYMPFRFIIPIALIFFMRRQYSRTYLRLFSVSAAIILSFGAGSMNNVVLCLLLALCYRPHHFDGVRGSWAAMWWVVPSLIFVNGIMFTGKFRYLVERVQPFIVGQSDFTSYSWQSDNYRSAWRSVVPWGSVANASGSIVDPTGQAWPLLFGISYGWIPVLLLSACIIVVVGMVLRTAFRQRSINPEFFSLILIFYDIAYSELADIQRFFPPTDVVIPGFGREEEIFFGGLYMVTIIYFLIESLEGRSGSQIRRFNLNLHSPGIVNRALYYFGFK